MLMLTGEHTIKFITLDANMGVHFRPRHSINDPNGGTGLGVGNELRWAARRVRPAQGRQVPHRRDDLRTDRHRERSASSATRSSRRRTRPIECNIEGRMKLRPCRSLLGRRRRAARRLLRERYGAPDFRIVGAPRRLRPDPRLRGEVARAPRGAPRQVASASTRPIAITTAFRTTSTRARTMPEDHHGQRSERRLSAAAGSRRRRHPGHSTTSAPTHPRTRTASTTATAAPRTTPTTTASPTRRTRARRSPGKPNTDPKKNGCPTFIKVERQRRPHPPAGALRDRHGARSFRRASRCSRRSPTS